MSKRGYFWLQTAFAALAWCAVAFLVLAFWIAANGCQGRSAASAASARPSDLPAAVKAQGEAATEVREATNDIQNSAAKIEVAAPEVATDVTAIFTGVKRLRSAWESMLVIKTTLEGEVKTSARLAKDLAAANKRIAELEAKESGFLSKLLAGAAAAGLLVAVLSFAWLRNATGVLVGVSVFAACVVGQWIIAYRLWIAIGGIAVNDVDGDLASVQVMGDSMSPTLLDGDTIIIDCGARTLDVDAIYVIHMLGQRLVKRLQRRFDGSVTIISDNAAYERETVPRGRVAEIEVLVAGAYVKKDDLEKLSNAIFAKLDRIEDKLDLKVDKP